MLAIEVVFLTGRYVATAYNTRTEGEWPPHPARVFSALAATHFAADPGLTQGLAEERALLEWLEQQGPPQIRATEATAREVVTVFVPVNDVALTNVDGEAHAVLEARAKVAGAEENGDAKSLKTAQKSLKAAQDAYSKALAKAINVPAKSGDPKAGARVLPDQRGRQPRTFPSVTPAEPVVEFIWPTASPTSQQRARLDGLLARVVRVGHSSTLVSMRTLNEPREPTWVPFQSGSLSLRVFEPGQLTALERAFETHREVEPRVMPARQQLYARPTAVGAEAPAQSVFGDDWLVLRRVGGPHVPMTATAGIARQVRRALMSFADSIPEVLSGHSPSRSPSEQPHMAVVPLPFIGHANASGLILGVALVLPRAAGADQRTAVFRAVAGWEAKSRVEDEDAPALPLHLGEAGEFLLERVEWGAVASTLLPRVWCQPSCVWSSVTPVALDQNPGDLRSRDPRKLLKATAEAKDTITKGCVRIGLPPPISVEILPAAPWAIAAKARQYPRFPVAPDRTQRVLTHARLVFDRPVSGPVLIGAGRYVGLGLFRPESGA